MSAAMPGATVALPGKRCLDVVTDAWSPVSGHIPVFDPKHRAGRHENVSVEWDAPTTADGLAGFFGGKHMAVSPARRLRSRPRPIDPWARLHDEAMMRYLNSRGDQ